jgi:hypothetical protein
MEELARFLVWRRERTKEIGCAALAGEQNRGADVLGSDLAFENVAVFFRGHRRLIPMAGRG